MSELVYVLKGLAAAFALVVAFLFVTPVVCHYAHRLSCWLVEDSPWARWMDQWYP